MPSEKVLLEKQAQVAALVERLKGAKSAVLVDYKGINVADDTKLRAELREENVVYEVVKNTLLARACKEAGLEEFVPCLNGTTALATGEDEVAPARVLQKYASKNKEFFDMKIGCVDGKIMNVDELKALAALPSRDTLIAMVAGSLNSIIASFARAISEIAKKNAEAEA